MVTAMITVGVRVLPLHIASEPCERGWGERGCGMVKGEKRERESAIKEARIEGLPQRAQGHRGVKAFLGE
jgi:hypothetical protein